jgi:fermentation-respiration switch protein FrsA (DUF1100 family)
VNVSRFGELILALVFLYALFSSLIAIFQRRILFWTIPYNCNSPVKSSLEPSHFVLTTPDGERLDAVWLPSAKADAAAIMYLHGNAANLRCRECRLKALTDLGYSVLAIDWRGYGQSTGMPSEEGLLVDAKTAYDWLVQRADRSRVVVLAESIASAIGIRLAAEHAVGALALEAPYYSAVDLAQKYLPVIPVRVLMRDPFRSDLWIGNLHVPLLIQHGRQDHLIPFSQAERLFAIAPEPKRIIGYSTGHHDDLPEKQYSYRDLKTFIDESLSQA